jgi:hypothetical protein
MSKKTRWLLAGLSAPVIAAMWSLNTYLYRVAAQQKDALSLFSQSVTLGMPRAETDRRCNEARASGSGWDYDPNVVGLGASVALVKTPLTFGAQNWVVYIVFEQDVVVAVLVRTTDSRFRRPTGSPQDRIRDARATWLAAFTAH